MKLPHNHDAERAALGAMLVDLSGESLRIGLQQLRPDSFYTLQLRTIFQAAGDLHHQGVPADLVTMKHELMRRNELQAVGGVDQLVALAESVPSVANAVYYFGILKRLQKQRTLMELGYRLKQAASNYDADPDALAAQFRQEVDQVFSGEPVQVVPKTVNEIELDRRLSRMEQQVKRLRHPPKEKLPATVTEKALRIPGLRGKEIG